ncbi:MAG: hypothetical protein H0V12_02420 [Chloroflexi bacterium]|nr:hypothetical protein [Chloroflexota bacterium]
MAPAAPFMVGGIADRGPLERGTLPTPEPRARDSRELDRQRQWRQSATRAIDALHADAGTGPVSEPPDDEDEDEAADTVEGVGAAAPVGEPLRLPGPAAVPAEPDLIDEEDGDDDEDLDDDEESLAGGSNGYDRLGATAPDGYATSLPTVHVLAFGISRKRLEQAIRELQLPVILVREVEEADAVVTLRNYFRQKAPALRDAEDRALPIYVLKANTIRQMEACLTSMFSLEVDPGEAAMRETAEAIGLVQQGDKPIELSPQNAYIRRLQHQMAEQANLVSRSRGREPYRRVRLYPDRSRVWR